MRRGSTILVTGSSGLIGSEAVRYFGAQGHRVVGLDNNGRRDFFGPDGDTRPTLKALMRDVPRFEPNDVDVRDQGAVEKLVQDTRPDAIVHCAGQPSHDLAKTRPFDDFHTNATGTLNLLEAVRRHAPDSPFVHMSTNKVYGDAPNERPLKELETRWEFADEADANGIDETCRIDASLHSLFGVSKASADLMVQEYGRMFGLRTVCFRAGCMTGPAHAGVQLHGFLSYLVLSAIQGRTYTIIGYRGKQVRDQIHAHDVCTAIDAWLARPTCGAVYNLGGGRESHGSVLECIALVEEATGKRLPVRFDDTARSGDHICYVSDMTRFQDDHPEWSLSRRLPDMVEEMVLHHGGKARSHATGAA